MKICITGINGFLGGHLANALSRQGHQVSGTCRSARGGLVFETQSFALSDKTCAIDLSSVDCLIHNAHDFSPGAEQRNIEGTKLLFRHAQKSGVRHQLFISSYSAHAGAQTSYGKIKYLLEQFFLENSQPVVRPGLIIGNGGLFLRIQRLVSRSLIVPLPEGGYGKVPVVEIDDLCAAISTIVERLDQTTGIAANLFYESKTTLRELVKLLKQKSRWPTFFIPVPIAPLLPLVRALEACKVALPISYDNLLGFKVNQDVDRHSELTKWCAPLSLADAVRKYQVERQNFRG